MGRRMDRYMIKQVYKNINGKMVDSDRLVLT